MLKRKPYDDLLGEYGKPGELVAKQLMARKGFSCYALPHGTCGPDILCESQYERFFLECERRKSNWTHGRFPFALVNIPARRKVVEDSIFIVLRSDLERCLVVFYEDMAAASLVIEKNKYMKEEHMRKVPIQRCLEFDIKTANGDPFNKMNADRIRAALANPSIVNKQPYIDGCCPYGIPDDEWRMMLVEVGKPVAKKITDRDRQKWLI